MRLYRLPEIVDTERRVSEVVRQRIPGYRTGKGERPTAERAATTSWYDEMVAARRSLKLVPSKSLGAVSYLPSIVTMAISCIVLRYW